MLFFFVLFLSFFFFWQYEKKHREHWKNQCRQWIRNRQSLSGLMPPRSFGSWSQQVLQSESQRPANCPSPITSPLLASYSALDDYVLTQVPISTQSKRTLSSVKSITQGLWQLVNFSQIKSVQSKMKNRRLLSFYTKPAIPIFFGGVSVPVLRFECFVSVPDSSHWTLCIQRRPQSSLSLPVCAHFRLFAKQIFTFQKFKTFLAQKENKPSFLTLSLNKKQRQESVAAHHFNHPWGDGCEEQRRVRSWAKSTRNQHTSWVLPYFFFITFPQAEPASGARRCIWPLIPLVTPQNVLAMLLSVFGCLLYTT